MLNVATYIANYILYLTHLFIYIYILISLINTLTFIRDLSIYVFIFMSSSFSAFSLFIYLFLAHTLYLLPISLSLPLLTLSISFWCISLEVDDMSLADLQVTQNIRFFSSFFYPLFIRIKLAFLITSTDPDTRSSLNSNLR